MQNLTTEIEAFFTDLQSLAQVIAPMIAFLGFIGLGIVRRVAA